jgi:hypothetical protein
MRNRLVKLAGALAFAVAANSLAAVVSGQNRETGAAPAGVPRTVDGHPDLHGVYDVATITPVERPRGVSELILSDDTAARLERAEKARTEERALPSPVNRAAPPIGGNVGGYNNFWIDRGTEVVVIDGQARSSLVTDPADGKIPPMIPEARQRNAARAGQASPDASETSATGARYDNPEERPLGADTAQLLLQQPQTDRADARLRDDPQRDGARCAHHQDRGPASGIEHPQVDG